jgi:hypothetical protein
VSALADLDALLYPPARFALAAWSALTDWPRLTANIAAALLDIPPGDGAVVADRWLRCRDEWRLFWSAERQRDFNSNLLAKNAAPSGEALSEFLDRLTVAASLARDRDAASAAGRPHGLNESANERVRAWTRLVAPGGIGASVSVPVALVDLGEQSPQGVVALLELTLLENGCGAVCRHPDWTANVAEEFTDSMTTAWEAARGAIAGDPRVPSAESSSAPRAAVDFDGVWRIHSLADSVEISPGRPIPEARGTSAGGAALRGWWHLLRGLTPDDGVIVCAEVRQFARGYQLCAVAEDGRTTASPGRAGEWLEAKVAAVARDTRFDRLVLVKDGNAERIVADALTSLSSARTTVDVRWLG